MTEPSETDPRFGALLDRLLHLTHTQAIHWSKSISRRSTGEPFSVNLTASTVRIRSKDDDGLAPYVVEVLDSTGVVVESIERSSFHDATENSNYNIVLSELYSLARRDALDVNNILDNLIQELDEEDSQKKSSS